MIGVLDVEVQAVNPAFPLFPMRAYVNSPSSVRVRNVPRKIGDWNITDVQLVVSYPDNSIKTANCIRVGCVWVGTVEGSTISGKSENGFTIYASGIDENGDVVTGYVLGKGLVEILENDGTITPGQDTYYLHLYDEQPTTPKEGDVWKNPSGEYFVWQNNQANSLGASAEWVIQQLASKQDILSTQQLSAIESVIDERATYVTYDGGTSASFNIVGELSSSSITDIANVVSVKVGTSVTSIAQQAFAANTKLQTIYLGDNVTTVGVAAFGGCTALTKVDVGDKLTSVGDGAFAGCINFSSVTFPKGMTTVGTGAFNGCVNLIEVWFPSTITSIGSGAFSGTASRTHLYFKDWTNIVWVRQLANYPWGIANESFIQTWNEATKEWVTEQNYASNYPFVVGSISPMGGRKMTLQPYKVTTFTISSAVNSFKIVPSGTAGTIMREYYLSLTLGAGVTQPITWDSTVDVFDGGSAVAVAPKGGKTNLYHIYEYISGHFAVSLLGSAYDALGDIETILNNL